MNDLDLHWLAGLLEGEGSFGSYKIKSTGQRTWQINFTSVDKDVTERVAALFECRIGGPYQYGSAPFYTAKVCARDKVLKMCELLYPLMGIRRRYQIQKVLDYA